MLCIDWIYKFCHFIRWEFIHFDVLGWIAKWTTWFEALWLFNTMDFKQKGVINEYKLIENIENIKTSSMIHGWKSFSPSQLSVSLHPPIDSRKTLKNRPILPILLFLPIDHPLSPHLILPLTFPRHHNSIPPHSCPELSFLQLIQVHDLFLEFSSFLESLENDHVQFWDLFFAAGDSRFHCHKGFYDQAELGFDLV